MAEGQMLFSLDSERFRAALSSLSSRYPNGFSLQQEFKIKGVPLSQSLLIWSGESGHTWLLADFENKRAYDIEEEDDPAGNRASKVHERSSEGQQLFTLTGTGVILSHLQAAQGTDQGFIDFLKRLDLHELDLERLKRSDLSGAGFSFEFIHLDFSNVYSMLREILTAPREWTLNFRQGATQEIVRYLQQFYEISQKIEDFVISSENPRETYDSLLQEISSFCNSAKEPLRHILTHLASRKVEQLAAEVNTTVATAVGRLETETNRAAEINNEAEKKQAAMQQEFDRLKIEVENKLAEKPISQYKTIFADQAKKHRDGAWFWLGMTCVGIVVFFIAFYKLPTFLESGGSESTRILQNFFAKVFLLSPIYLWLRACLKSHFG